MGMTIGDKFIELLPDDGSPVLNRVVRLMLSRSLGRAVSPEEYFNVRDQLLVQRLVGRARGPGGKVYLLPNVVSTTEKSAYTASDFEEASEVALMPFLAEYLSGAFRESLDLPADASCFVENTSFAGPRRGRWSRPDFLLVSVSRFRFVPDCQVDVHSFELKTEAGADVLAVYEALAQTRFSHFRHLVWQLAIGSRHEARLEEIRSQCQSHGVGLILMRAPAEPASYEIVVDPERKPTPPSIIDGALEARLAPATQSALASAVRSR